MTSISGSWDWGLKRKTTTKTSIRGPISFSQTPTKLRPYLIFESNVEELAFHASEMSPFAQKLRLGRVVEVPYKKVSQCKNSTN